MERRAPVLVGSLFLLHSIALLLLFDPIAGLYDSRPILEQDWGLHFHHLTAITAFWQNDRMLWGYNPFFMAGYPSNTIQDLSIKLFELLSLPSLQFGFEPVRAFKLAVYLSAAVLPWTVYFTARNFFFGASVAVPASVLAALLGTAYWWNSQPREMFFSGVVGFPPAVYLALFAVSLLYRMIKSESAPASLGLAWIVTVSALPPLHFQSIAIAAPPALVLLAMNLGSLRRRSLAWLGAGVALAFVVNLPWILPLLSHRADDVSAAIVEELRLFTSSDPATIVKDYLGPDVYWSSRVGPWQNGLRWLLLVFGAIGLKRLMDGKKKDVGVALAAGAAGLALFSYFGSFVSFLINWQPLRFRVGYELILVLAAAYFIAGHENDRASPARAWIFRGALVATALAFAINLFETESNGDMLLRSEPPAEINAVVEWIRSETPPDGRILFEESGDETDFFYKGVYLSSLLPAWTGRELIGGPINLYNDRHHFAEFHSAMLFKREIDRFTNRELREYFRLYNIGAIVAFHPLSVARLRAVEGLVSVERRIGDLHLMKVDQPLGWFLEGDGEVAVSFNRIRASKVRGEEIVLKYHWLPGLVSDPPATIAPEIIGDDPIPFIKIVHPPEAFTLSVRGAAG